MTKPHVADPASCLHCARVTPERCKRHGGPSHSTSFGGHATDQQLRDKDDRYLGRPDPAHKETA